MLQPQFTLYSDDEVENESNDEESDIEDIVSKLKSKQDKKKKKVKKQQDAFSFQFDDGEVQYSRLYTSSESEEDESSDEEIEDGSLADNVKAMPRTEERAQRAVDKILTKRKHHDLKERDESALMGMGGMDQETEKAFFDEVVSSTAEDIHAGLGGGLKNFSQLNLSRPLLRAIEAAGYISPTPVQAKVIPFALEGRDVCASAVTGSGKTAAFVLPTLERLLYRPKDVATIRILVVTPTRELATQIFSVLQKLAQFTDITCTLICGGKRDLKSQEATLRQRPDIVICTPGRIIDHLRNSQSVSIDDLDVLVLDEVDRLLELGFQAELEELVRFCPEARQTLLFSATMTPKVEDLARLSLKKPVRIKTSAGSGLTTLAPRLVQEFIKVRPERDDEREREALLAALVCRSFNKRTIAFFETKKEAHRFYVLLSLLAAEGAAAGVTCVELHGDMTQTMRYLALEKFRTGEVEVMVCTDVAARGLDIPRVQTVINAEMPRTASTYVHRVGRTARAGCGGRSVTLVGDARRKVMKEVLKGEGSVMSNDGGQVLSRTVPQAVVNHFTGLIASLESQGKVDEFYREEKLKRNMELAEREAEKAENLLLYENEINARPARTWYQTETQKKDLREAGRVQAQEEGSGDVLSGKEGSKNVPGNVLGKKGEGSGKVPGKVRTPLELLKAQANRGDYRLEADSKDKTHRLSRLKRRRLEALKAEEADAEANDEDDSTSHRKEPSMKQVAKNAKSSRRETEAKVKDIALGEIGSKNSKVRSDSGGMKVIRPKFAVGGLDADLMDWGTGGAGGLKSKDAKRMQRQVEEFRGFDPDKKLRKGGKIGKSSFKSKSKFKRRK